MNLLYVTCYYKPAYVYGGPVRSVAALCEEMARQGANLTVYATNANRSQALDVPLNQAVHVNGVPVWYFPLSMGGLGYFYSPSQARAIQANARCYDLVVVEAIWGHPSDPTRAACQQAGVPYVVPLRGQLLPESLGQKRWKKQLYLWALGYRFLNHAAALHATDEVEARSAVQLKLNPPAFIVPNGVDTTRFANLPERGVLRKSLGIPSEAFVILMLGRLHPYKRPDLAIQVASQVQARLAQDVHLVLVGYDEVGLQPHLKALAGNLGYQDHVHFTGSIAGDQILQALADADLLLMPTAIQENFGMAALEALAAGVPVLTSRGVPVGRWAEQHGFGRTAAVDLDAFTETACEMLQDVTALRRAGKQAQAAVRQEFDIQVVARAMLAQYQAIIATGRPLAEKDYRHLLVSARGDLS